MPKHLPRHHRLKRNVSISATCASEGRERTARRLWGTSTPAKHPSLSHNRAYLLRYTRFLRTHSTTVRDTTSGCWSKIRKPSPLSTRGSPQRIGGGHGA